MKAIHCKNIVALILATACAGFADVGAQSTATALPTLQSTIADTALTGRIDRKNYSVGGMISMSGNINTMISNADSTVSATVGMIRNDSPTVTSGALRLRVFVTPIPYDGTRAYY